MLQVTDSTLKRLLLGQIVEAIESGGMDDLLRRGFRPEFLDVLRHRKARDLIELARQDAVRFAVAIDQDAMLAALKRLDWRRGDGMLYEYFVAHGATVQMVCTLFRKSADEVRSLRALTLPKKALKGHSRMLYLGYAGSSQIECLKLMAKKISVSQSTSGDMPDSGLDVLNDSGDSLEVALAKKLLAH
jgi:hypothetical protein